MRAADPDSNESMGDVDITDNLMTFITAGHETTALALTWTFYLLALNPKVEERVVDEVQKVTGGGPSKLGTLKR
jgi:cytochrome P450